VHKQSNNEFKIQKNELMKELARNVGCLVDFQLCIKKEEEKQWKSASYVD